MPYHDLNVAYALDHAVLSNTLLFAKELGYDTVALSIAVTGKLASHPPVISIQGVNKPDNLRILTRLTLTVSDTAHNHRLPALGSHYDIIALRPTNEKTLQQCCSNLECDLISLDFSQRLLFPLKFKTVASALQRGVRFEICYAAGIVAGADARRHLISGATQLIRATRGRGVLVSSEAKTALGLRAPWDVINLAQIWGLSQQRAKEAVCEEAGKVLRLAGIKRTSYRGVVDIVDGGSRKLGVTKDLELQAKGKGKAVQESQAQSTMSESTKQDPSTIMHGTKRKASVSSMNITQPTDQAGDKPLSKREMKKRAKKARLERKPDSDVDVATATNGTSSVFPLQHESLVANKPK